MITGIDHRSARQHVCFLLTLGGTLAPLLLAPLTADSTLFHCRDASGSSTYTDSPAQLESCTPVLSAPLQVTGASPSLPDSMPHAPLMNMTPPPFMPPPDGQIAPPALPDMPPPQSQGTPMPPITAACHPGFNPLNQFSAPPCRTAEPPASAPTAPALPTATPPGMP